MKVCVKCPIHPDKEVEEICVNQNRKDNKSRLACHSCYRESDSTEKWIQVDKFIGDIKNIFSGNLDLPQQEYKQFVNTYLKLDTLDIDAVFNKVRQSTNDAINKLQKSLSSPFTQYQQFIKQIETELMNQLGFNTFRDNFYAVSELNLNSSSKQFIALDDSLNKLVEGFYQLHPEFDQKFIALKYDEIRLYLSVLSRSSLMNESLEQCQKTIIQSMEKISEIPLHVYEQEDQLQDDKFMTLQAPQQDLTTFDNYLICQLTNLEELFLNFNIVREVQCEKQQQLKLLYKGTRDGLNSNAFKYLCFNQGCTLMIIQTNKNQFIGGYSVLPWNDYGQKRMVDDSKKSFIFSITKQKIFNLIDKQRQSIRCYKYTEKEQKLIRQQSYINSCISDLDDFNKSEQNYLRVQFNDDLHIRMPDATNKTPIPATLLSKFPSSYGEPDFQYKQHNDNEVQYLLNDSNNEKDWIKRPRVIEMWVYGFE